MMMIAMFIAGAGEVAAGTRSEIWSPPTDYDWLVSSSPEVTQGDMVASALEKAANLDDVAGAIEGGASDERSEQASVLYSFSFLYYPKEDPAGPADIFTAANLQQMCEVENVLFVSDVLKHETAPKQVDRMRAVAAKWGSMSDAEKAPYQRRAAEAKAAM